MICFLYLRETTEYTIGFDRANWKSDNKYKKKLVFVVHSHVNNKEIKLSGLWGHVWPKTWWVVPLGKKRSLACRERKTFQPHWRTHFCLARNIPMTTLQKCFLHFKDLILCMQVIWLFNPAALPNTVLNTRRQTHNCITVRCCDSFPVGCTGGNIQLLTYRIFTATGGQCFKQIIWIQSVEEKRFRFPLGSRPAPPSWSPEQKRMGVEQNGDNTNRRWDAPSTLM